MLSQMRIEYSKRQKLDKTQQNKQEDSIDSTEDRQFYSVLAKMAEQVKIYYDMFYYREPNYFRISEQQMVQMIRNRCLRIIERKRQNLNDSELRGKRLSLSS